MDYNELIGQSLGTCKLQKLIGRGGMGAVYLAQQLRPRRTVAVKVLMPGIVQERKSYLEFQARFQREADAIAALDHVNIMPIYEYGEQDDATYLVMPYVTGGTLRTILEERGLLPPEEALPIIEQAAAALDCAHAQGIVHRDLKPGNILFHADGRALLADFGLAKILKETKESEESSQGDPSTLTTAGSIIGTPEYLSPEQAAGMPIDHRTDIYSLGVVLFQMLAGRVPFSGPSPVVIAVKHSLEEPPTVSQINPAISPQIEAVVMKALAKDPQQRYASAGELAQVLRAAVSGSALPQMQHAWYPAPAEPLKPVTLPGPDDNQDIGTLHNAPTQEAPRIPAAARPPAVATGAKIQPDDPMDRAARRASRVEELAAEVQPVPIIQRQQAQEPIQSPIAPTQKRSGGQSRSLLLLGILLLLVFIVGGAATYLYIAQHNHTVPSLVTPQTASKAANSSATLPAALIPVGRRLYGTTLPGHPCDTQGGKWSNLPDTKIQCNNSATGMLNTGQHVGGSLLTGLPNGQQTPNDYIIQVQATVNPDSHGNFGVFFRNQPGSQQGTYSFMLSPGGSWTAYVYDNVTGQGHSLYGYHMQGALNGTVTIDIMVQGNRYNFYVNGILQGYVISNQYPSGSIGLAADSGADISFKNLALYALP